MRIKLIILLSFLFTVLFKLAPVAYADTNFQTDLSAEYKILDSGKTTITNTVTIKNLKSEYFPKKYILNLKGVSPENIKAYESGTRLDATYQESGVQKTITINFDSLSVGKGTTKTFIVAYEDSTLAKKTGEIWEIVLPKVADSQNYNTYKVNLSVPSTLGEEAYVSPEPTSVSKLDDRTVYKFDDYLNFKSGVTAGFGIFQVFSFSLSYHLDNLEAKTSIETLALPPDTSTQKMFYENIDPKPQNIVRDVDGNWIASYKLESKEKLTVTANGYVQIFSSPNKLSDINLPPNESDLAPTTYWQSDDIKIKNIAERLDGINGVYDYVVGTLKYNYSQITGDYLRYGALHALENPEDALCMEFTDLFIALARAKGIPAREINGYAYSMNPEVEPLSLVTDVLHSWPEYWDEQNKVWIPVDPTWASTTGSSDFFYKFDLRHFAFVVHGANPVTPYSVGTYKNSNEPGKDVQVNFGKLPERTQSNVKFSNINKQIVPYFIDKITISVENDGPNALYGFPVKINSDNFSKMETVATFLPFTKKETSFNLNYGLLSLNAPDIINIELGNLKENIQVNKVGSILGQLIEFSILVIILITYFYWKSHKNMFYSGFFAKILDCATKIFQKRNF